MAVLYVLCSAQLTVYAPRPAQSAQHNFERLHLHLHWRCIHWQSYSLFVNTLINYYKQVFKQVASTWIWNALSQKALFLGSLPFKLPGHGLNMEYGEIVSRLVSTIQYIVTSITDLQIEELYLLFKSLTIAIHSAFPIPAPGPPWHCLINECTYTTLLLANRFY